MDLRDSKFYSAGHEVNFAVFSDNTCRVRYLESIPLPLGHTMVDVYAIEPAANSQWVVVEVKEEETSRLRFFVRRGITFPEDGRRRLPESVRTQLQQRVPRMKGSRRRFQAA